MAMAKLTPLSRLLNVFPALHKLGRGLRGKQIPYVQQMTRADCGAACLTMVLGYHGRDVRLGEVREITSTSRDGTTAHALAEAARWYGLRVRSYTMEVDDLADVSPASILHWDLNHFVVFQRLTRRGVYIVDPAVGRRFVPLGEFDKHFTGVVQEFEPGEDFEPGLASRRVVRRYLAQLLGEPGVALRILLTSLLVQGFALALPLFTKVLVDRIAPRGDRNLLLVLAAGFFAVVAFNLLTSIIRAHLLLHLRTVLDARLTAGFVEHLMRLPYAFFQRRSVGDLVMRLNSNATVREVLTSSALSGLLDGSLVILYFIILFIVSPPMAWLIAGLTLLQAALFVFSRRRYRELMTQELERQARSQGYEVQMLAGIETLKSSGTEERAGQHWSNLFVDVLNVTLARGRLSAWVDSLMASLRMGSPLLILCVGALLVLSENEDIRISLGTMLAINALAGALIVPFSALMGTALQLTTLRSYIERIDDVLETEPEQSRRAVARAHALQGHIALADVSFKYGELSPLVVKAVSVDIRPGQHVAIVGRSGSGKSTLARLLVGLYAPTEGRILYDGVDLAGLDYQSVRRQLGFVPQVPYLFGITIRSNIALANPELSLDEIQKAARLAHIHDDIDAMPLKYDTPLPDGGMSLSGGQRQRIALARALAEQPRILVLDEATSDLDTVTEGFIQKELEALRCTVVVIAHRLSTIVNADAILVMKNGEVVERGTHKELKALNGEYAALISAQIPSDKTGPLP
jgi:ATP-binding cassette subfamily B protein